MPVSPVLDFALALAVAAAPPQAEHPASHTMPMEMTGSLGSYLMSRDASGTSWQPDSTPHAMGHVMRGDWTLMGHTQLNAVYDDQQGPRGDDLGFVAGMVMGSARRDAANGDALTLRAMLSPDPFMGKRGYPLLLAAGETADGVTTLTDRQHPHDLFMELSATYARQFGDKSSAYLYMALPGEPAFGPPAFMHRSSTMMSPEAPITHHWLDSTHISFGVITAGWIRDRWKFEASQFTGREPDEDRYDIERPRLDSTALRASWNPDDRWSLQLSWADVESPEQLEPAVDEARVSASAIYTVALDNGRSWSTTLAWGFKNPNLGESTDAIALETAYVPARDWTLFGRAEWVETHELTPTEDIFQVSKLSLGVLREFRVTERIGLGLGGLYSFNRVEQELEAAYGGSPEGAMIFLQFTAGT
jgi:hypothetical protein